MSVQITLRKPNNRLVPTTLPDDVILSRLIPVIIEKLTLPISDNGQPISYTLHRKNELAGLPLDLTLAESSIKDGDYLILQINPEKTNHTPKPLHISRSHSDSSSEIAPTRIIQFDGILNLKILMTAILLGVFSATILILFGVTYLLISGNLIPAQLIEAFFPPPTQWQFTLNQVNSKAPVVDNGIVYFGDQSDTTPDFYAVTASSGERIWQYTADSGINSTPAVTDKLVIFSTAGGVVYGLDPTSGSEIWRFTPKDRGLSGEGCNVCTVSLTSPILANGIVYIGSWDNNLYALNAETGKEVWRFKTNNSIMDDPTIANGLVYFGDNGGLLHILDAETGELVQRVNTLTQRPRHTYSSTRVTTPAIDVDTVFITNGSLSALNHETGEEIWRKDIDDFWHGSTKRPLIDAQFIFTIDDEHSVYAIDKMTGELIWHYPHVNATFFSELTLHNGKLYFGDDKNRLIVLDAQTGDKLIGYNLGNLKLDPMNTLYGNRVINPAFYKDLAFTGLNNKMITLKLPDSP